MVLYTIDINFSTIIKRYKHIKITSPEKEKN